MGGILKSLWASYSGVHSSEPVSNKAKLRTDACVCGTIPCNDTHTIFKNFQNGEVGVAVLQSLLTSWRRLGLGRMTLSGQAAARLHLHEDPDGIYLAGARGL